MELLEGERWWGGRVADGIAMPFAVGAAIDLRDHRENQAAPLLVSNRGRVVWADGPFSFTMSETAIELRGPTEHQRVGATLRDAVRWSAEHVNHQPRAMPGRALFDPQWVTWIELLYDQTQEGTLAYAEQILANGYRPGVLMIDDNWNQDYGVWEFRPDRFPDPGTMVARLHSLGFNVMLWVCPYVSPDGVHYLELRDAGLLLSDPSGEPVIRRWWNGYSAVLDLTNPATVDWFRSRLTELQSRYGIDGFKFDGADPDMYDDADATFEPSSPTDQVHRYGLFAEEFSLNELRSGWNLGGRGLATRLLDAHHSWDENGIGKLIPNHLAQGLLGMPFGAPDMIGGGQYLDFDEDRIDPEVFVRHAQIAALCPMMQFSAAPWRLLDQQHADAVHQATLLREQYRDRIDRLASEWLDTGDPIMRPIAYDYPEAGLDDVTDCFLLGPDLLVAPVLKKGATSRRVPLPDGNWVDHDGRGHMGGAVITVDVDLTTVPRFLRT